MQVVLVEEVPTVEVKGGIVYVRRAGEVRAQTIHTAEATSRKVLAAIAEWREQRKDVVVPFDRSG